MALSIVSGFLACSAPGKPLTFFSPLVTVSHATLILVDETMMQSGYVTSIELAGRKSHKRSKAPFYVEDLGALRDFSMS